jgi:hypothetical protein
LGVSKPSQDLCGLKTTLKLSIGGATVTSTNGKVHESHTPIFIQAIKNLGPLNHKPAKNTRTILIMNTYLNFVYLRSAFFDASAV